MTTTTSTTPQPAVTTKEAIVPHLVYELFTSGASVSAATCCTNPVDVVKVRIQLEKAGGRAPGLIATATDLVRNEGVLSLWKGLTPSVARAFFYGGARLGLYHPIKNAIHIEDANLAIYKYILAGAASGALAAGFANPTDLVKTRLQARGCQHSGPLQVVRAIVAADGIAGLWKGTGPSMARAAVLTASQCATYDTVKHWVLTWFGGDETVATHVIASMMTGVVTTTATSPVDVLKTRMFVGGGSGAGAVRVAARIAAQEGLGGFFRGWTANYARLGPQTLITFVVAEQLRRVCGLEAM